MNAGVSLLTCQTVNISAVQMLEDLLEFSPGTEEESSVCKGRVLDDFASTFPPTHTHRRACFYGGWMIWVVGRLKRGRCQHLSGAQG